MRLNSNYLRVITQRTYLETSKAAATGEADVADVRGAVGGNHFVNDQGAVPQVGPSGQLHLPKLLQSLHHIHWRGEKRRPRHTYTLYSVSKGNIVALYQ